MIIASPACRHDIVPRIRATRAQRHHMIARECSCRELAAAVHTQVYIAGKQGGVTQRRASSSKVASRSIKRLARFNDIQPSRSAGFAFFNSSRCTRLRTSRAKPAITWNRLATTAFTVSRSQLCFSGLNVGLGGIFFTVARRRVSTQRRSPKAARLVLAFEVDGNHGVAGVSE